MDVIKRAYKTLSLKHHPDKADDPTDQEVQSKYINIVKAYETLTGIIKNTEVVSAVFLHNYR